MKGKKMENFIIRKTREGFTLFWKKRGRILPVVSGLTIRQVGNLLVTSDKEIKKIFGITPKKEIQYSEKQT